MYIKLFGYISNIFHFKYIYKYFKYIYKYFTYKYIGLVYLYCDIGLIIQYISL